MTDRGKVDELDRRRNKWMFDVSTSGHTLKVIIALPLGT